jgi:hypothetical protein
LGGPWSDYASVFLQVVGIGSLVLLAVPLVVAPLAWARVLRWDAPGDADLTVYFGRCLGAVIGVLAAAALVAAGNPTMQPFFFGITIGSFALMVAVHAWGAVRGIQPRTETFETFGWLALLVVAVLCFPAG